MLYKSGFQGGYTLHGHIFVMNKNSTVVACVTVVAILHGMSLSIVVFDNKPMLQKQGDMYIGNCFQTRSISA